MGSTRVVFTPMSGADVASPPAYLLQLGTPAASPDGSDADASSGFTFLLDAGWDGRFDEAALASLAAATPRIDAVLLSHPDVAHLGALPALAARYGLQAPVYATVPVHRMGRLALREACLSRASESDFAAFSLADVDAAFGAVTQLRWRQTVSLEGKGEGLSITAFPAGHLIGGSVWRISWQGEDFVYAVDINHRKERLLNGAALEAAVSRPALLITDALNAQQMQPEGGNWEAELLAALKAALRADGKVLIAVDAAGRVLELLLALERAWGGGRLPYPLVLCSGTSKAVVEAAKALLQWLADGLQRAFEADRDNPFTLKHVQLCHRLEDLDRLLPGPAVVLATGHGLEAGPGRALLTRWATDSRNLIVVPGKPQPGSLAAQVVEQAAARAAGGPPATLQFSNFRRVPLTGQELADHLAEQQESAAAAAAAAAEAAERHAAGGEASAPSRLSSSVIAKAGAGGSLGSAAAAGLVAEAAAVPQSDHSAVAEVAAAAVVPAWREVLVEGFTVPAGAVGAMFPDEDEGDDAEWDDYGAAIDPAAFAAHEAAAPAPMDVDSADTAGAAGAVADAGPTKVVTEHIDLLLRAKVLAVPGLEGRSDGRSQRTIIGQVAPRHLIVVRGSDEARGALAAHCRAELAAVRTTVHVPAPGQAVDVSAGCAVFRVGVSPAVAAGTKLRAVGEYQLGWLAGVVGPPPLDGGLPELLPAPNGAALPDGQGGVFIGDVRLSDLKRALTKAGMASDWEGPGALVAAGGRVRVRLAPPGSGCGDGAEAGKAAVAAPPENATIMLEGGLCPEYYAVRDLLYSQYHIC